MVATSRRGLLPGSITREGGCTPPVDAQNGEHSTVAASKHQASRFPKFITFAASRFQPPAFKGRIGHSRHQQLKKIEQKYRNFAVRVAQSRGPPTWQLGIFILITRKTSKRAPVANQHSDA